MKRILLIVVFVLLAIIGVAYGFEFYIYDYDQIDASPFLKVGAKMATDNTMFWLTNNEPFDLKEFTIVAFVGRNIYIMSVKEIKQGDTLYFEANELINPYTNERLDPYKYQINNLVIEARTPYGDRGASYKVW